MVFHSESDLTVSQRGLITATRRLVSNFGSASTWRIVRHLCPHSFANAIRFVYWRNILSSTVRAFISF